MDPAGPEKNTEERKVAYQSWFGHSRHTVVSGSAAAAPERANSK
jgi:hypothetical protein